MKPTEIENLLSGTLIFLAGWVISMLMQPFAIWLSPLLGLLDHPEERKVHTSVVPRAGGVAIWVSISICITAYVFFFPNLSQGMTDLILPALAVLALAALGLIDDLRPLPWWPRLIVHFGCATLVLFFAEKEISGILLLPAIFIIALITNAFNLIDNMDQQSGGVGLLLVLGLIYLGLDKTLLVEDSITFVVLPCLAGTLIGFLWWNRPPAKIFLGDGGSIPLGFFLAWLVLHILSSLGLENAWRWMALPALFFIPLYDLISVVLIRLSQGRSPFKPDRQHLSHRLESRGFSRKRAVSIILLLQYAGIMIGLGILTVDDFFKGLAVFSWLILAIIALVSAEFRSRPA